MEDIERQFQFETYTLHLNTEVKGLKELAEQGFDAVYIATGKGGPDFGILDPEAKTVPELKVWVSLPEAVLQGKM